MSTDPSASTHSLCSCRRVTVACTFLLSQVLTAALHLKMDVPRMNQLSHCWSEGATQQRRGVAKTVSSEDFTSFNSVYSTPTLRTAPTVGERPHWPFFLPFHPLLSHGQSRLVAEVILIVFPVLRDLRSWVINAHSVPAAAFTFKNMQAQTMQLYKACGRGEVCKPLYFFPSRAIQTEAGEPTSQQGTSGINLRKSRKNLRGELSFGLCFDTRGLRFCLRGRPLHARTLHGRFSMHFF